MTKPFDDTPHAEWSLASDRECGPVVELEIREPGNLFGIKPHDGKSLQGMRFNSYDPSGATIKARTGGEPEARPVALRVRSEVDAAVDLLAPLAAKLKWANVSIPDTSISIFPDLDEVINRLEREQPKTCKHGERFGCRTCTNDAYEAWIPKSEGGPVFFGVDKAKAEHGRAEWLASLKPGDRVRLCKGDGTDALTLDPSVRGADAIYRFQERCAHMDACRVTWDGSHGFTREGYCHESQLVKP